MTTAISTEERICQVQGILLDMGIGMTKVVFDRVVTRWADDAFEVDTWGRGDLVSAETIAEQIVDDEA